MRILFLLTFLAGPAYAVDTTQCPARLELNYTDLIPVSETKIQQLKRNANPDVYPLALAAREKLIASTPESLQHMIFSFKSARRGACIYSSETESKAEVELYSRNRNHFMRVRFSTEDAPIYTIQPLTKVEPSGIDFDYRPITSIFVRIRNSAFHIGWAYSLSLTP